MLSLTGPFSARFQIKRTGAWDGALFTRLIPGTANIVGTAAHLLGHIKEQFSIAGLIVSIIISVAQTPPHICKENKNIMTVLKYMKCL